MGRARNLSICAIRDHPVSHCAQNPFFRRFDVVRMNIERSPVVNDEVLFRRDCDDSHLRVLPQQHVANGWSSAGMVERDDHVIWQRPLNVFGNLRLFANFADNFDVGLVRESCEDDFSHEPRTIRHQDPDNFFHCALPEGLESVHHWTVSKCPFFIWLGEGSKIGYWKTPLLLGSCTKQNLLHTKVDLFKYTYPGTVGQRLQCQSNPSSPQCTRVIQNLDT